MYSLNSLFSLVIVYILPKVSIYLYIEKHILHVQQEHYTKIVWLLAVKAVK